MRASVIILLFMLTLPNSLSRSTKGRRRRSKKKDEGESECSGFPGSPTVEVEAFYNHHSDKRGSTRHVIKSVCDQYPKFGSKMTVSFNLIARVKDTGNGPACDSGEDCSEELREMCTYLQAKDENGLICCMYQSANPAECYHKFGVTEDKILECEKKGYNSDAGRRLLESRNNLMDAKLDEGKLPAYVFNNEVYVECVDKMAYDNFLLTVCNMYGAFRQIPPC